MKRRRKLEDGIKWSCSVCSEKKYCKKRGARPCRAFSLDVDIAAVTFILPVALATSVN